MKKRTYGTTVFLSFLAFMTVVYGGVLAYHISNPQASEEESILEQCRILCLKYGLVPTGNIAKDANAYLAASQTTKLTDGLSAILGDERFQPVKTEPHTLVRLPAPAFTLKDSADAERSLSDWTSRGPVVLVFYYGYGCSHCVAQLFAIDKDLALFRELGAEVIAISSDSPEKTREKFNEYGEFGFPVLSDPENRTAQVYGVFDGKESEHGTFVINDGKIIWAYQGATPFLDNKTLLLTIAEAQGLIPRNSSRAVTQASSQGRPPAVKEPRRIAESGAPRGVRFDPFQPFCVPDRRGARQFGWRWPDL